MIRVLAQKACRDGCSALYRHLAIASAHGILDRLLHNAHPIDMRGESMRKQRSAKPTD